MTTSLDHARHARGKLKARAQPPARLGPGLLSWRVFWRADEFPLGPARSTNPAAAMTPNITMRNKDVTVQAMMIASCSRPAC
jgi:hypothetical protein